MGSGRLAVIVEFPRKADGRRVFSVAFKRIDAAVCEPIEDVRSRAGTGA
jgi:hypothetical protein